MSNQTVSITVYNLILTGTSSGLSILGATTIFVTYFRIREIRNFTRKLLVYLTVADLLTAVGNLVALVRYTIVHDMHKHVAENCIQVNETPTYEMQDLCVGQSFVTTFSNLCSFLWTTVIAAHIWSCIVLRTERTEAYYMHIFYHIFCWIVPLVIVCTLLQEGLLGEDYCFGTGVWCGIRSNLPPNIIKTWMYIADIGWQLASYLLICFLYMHVKCYIKLHHRGLDLAHISRRLRNEDKNFLFVWLILYLLKLWGMVRFFITTYCHQPVLNNTSMKGFLNFLLLMQSYGASGQAFWNCVLFCGCDKTIRTRVKTWLKGCYSGEERERLLRDLNNQGTE